MELKPGQKSHELRLAHIKGFTTFVGLSRFLGIPQGSHSILKAHMKALGITLEPFKRDEKYVKKQYKLYRRPFTEDEARRIIERHAYLTGRAFENEE